MPAPSGERGFKFSEIGLVLRQPGPVPAVAVPVPVRGLRGGGLELARQAPDRAGHRRESQALTILSLGFALGLLVGRLVVSPDPDQRLARRT